MTAPPGCGRSPRGWAWTCYIISDLKIFASSDKFVGYSWSALGRACTRNRREVRMKYGGSAGSHHNLRHVHGDHVQHKPLLVSSMNAPVERVFRHQGRTAANSSI